MHQPHAGLIHSPAICHQYKGDPFEGYVELKTLKKNIILSGHKGCGVLGDSHLRLWVQTLGDSRED